MQYHSELWWESVPGCAQLVEETASRLMRMEDTILYVDDSFAWPDVFRMSVKDTVFRRHPDYSMEAIDLSRSSVTDPGRWVLEHVGAGNIFCLPSDDPGLLALRNGLLKGRIFWVTGCAAEEEAAAWISFAKKMKRADRSKAGCVVLVLKEGAASASEMQSVHSGAYCSEYDLNFFASFMAASLPMKEQEKKYLSELAVHLSYGSAEHCAELAGLGKRLFSDPERYATWAKSSKCVHGIWKAQMRTFFAPIEEAKFDLLQRNHDAVKPLLGTTDDFGNTIDCMEDIELRHLVYNRKRSYISLPESESRLLDILHNARNELAHHRILNYSDIQTLESVL